MSINQFYEIPRDNLLLILVSQNIYFAIANIHIITRKDYKI